MSGSHHGWHGCVGTQREEPADGPGEVDPDRMYFALTSLRDGEEGQAMVEYALILALVSVAAVAILPTLGGHVSSIFNEINNDL